MEDGNGPEFHEKVRLRRSSEILRRALETDGMGADLLIVPKDLEYEAFLRAWASLGRRLS
jgi:hypothetical protein